MQRYFIVRFSLAIILLCGVNLRAADKQWMRVSSDHFIVLTDAGQKEGHEIAARFEQMRAVFADLLARQKVVMAEPLEIIAIGSADEYALIAPTTSTDPSVGTGFFIPAQDRIYIVLNTSVPDCWRAVEHPLAHYFLDFNYPPTQPWFDEGFAEYFASLYFSPKKVELGSDPELTLQNASVSPVAAGTSANTNLKSLTEILSSPVWLNLPDLLEMRNRVVGGQEGTHHTLFYAQSWMMMHYLLNKNMLPQTGTYFDLVENQHLPVEQAVQQAFGMSVAQLDQAVKDYFHSLKPLAATLEESKQPNPPVEPEIVNEQPLPFEMDDVGSSARQIPSPEAQALVAEMELRIPERRDAAIAQLQKLVADEHTETLVAHRALAWADVQKGDVNAAFEELNEAIRFNTNDAWTRFDLALAAYHSGENGARIQGLANTMESLHIVLTEYPDFAEAYNILGWARLAGGGPNGALEAMKFAVRLNPRDESYQLRYAEAFMGAKKWDEATSILERLKTSQDTQVAKVAKKDLNDLPYLKRFGIPPVDDNPPKKEAASTPVASAKAAKDDSSDDSDDDFSVQSKAVAAPAIDKRPVKFLKGKLLSVDCSQPPGAVLSVAEGKRTLHLRASDYNAIAVIDGQFSCGWKDVNVDINYRAGGKADGDVVSVEVH